MQLRRSRMAHGRDCEVKTAPCHMLPWPLDAFDSTLAYALPERNTMGVAGCRVQKSAILTRRAAASRFGRDPHNIQHSAEICAIIFWRSPFHSLQVRMKQACPGHCTFVHKMGKGRGREGRERGEGGGGSLASPNLHVHHFEAVTTHCYTQSNEPDVQQPLPSCAQARSLLM